MFDGEMLIKLDDHFDYDEDRCLGIGFLGSGIAVVVWTERQENIIRIISADRAKNLVLLDPDVKQWFQSQGTQYKTLVNKVLRQYVEQVKS